MISIRSVRPDTLSGRALAVIVSAGEDGIAVEQVVGHLADWMAERGASHNRDRIAVQRAVGRLVELRLVSGRGAPRVAAWAVEAVSAGRFSRRSDPWVALVEDYVGSEAPAVARLLRRVVEESPGSRAALKLSTQGERSYDRAVAGGLLLPPAARCASEAGRALVAEWTV